MKNTTIRTAIASLFLSIGSIAVFADTAPTTAPTTAPSTQPSAAFGREQKLKDTDNVGAQTVLANTADYNGKYVRVSGIVSAVCPAKGCWMRVQPEPGEGHESNIFVKFPDPPVGRLIPMEAVGHAVTVEGIVKDGTMSDAQARHLKQDAGATQQELDAIKGPQKQVSISGPAVVIEGVQKN